MKIYIACGLTHVPRSEFSEYVAFIHGLALHLSTTCSAQVKYALRDSDPQLAEKPLGDRARLCYLWGREMVEWADVVIAEASYPSTGLGIELQIAGAKDIPILITFQQTEAHKAPPVHYQTPDNAQHTLQLGEGYVSLMALGLPSVFKVLPYIKSQDAYSILTNTIVLLQRNNTRVKEN